MKNRTTGVIAIGAIVAIVATSFSYKHFFKPPTPESLQKISSFLENNDYRKAESILAKFDINNDKMQAHERIEFFVYKARVDVTKFRTESNSKGIEGLQELKKLRDQLRFADTLLSSGVNSNQAKLTQMLKDAEKELNQSETLLRQNSTKQLIQSNQMLFQQGVRATK